MCPNPPYPWLYFVKSLTTLKSLIFSSKALVTVISNMACCDWLLLCSPEKDCFSWWCTVTGDTVIRLFF